MRAYIPATWSDLAGDLLNPPAVYAVTPELAESFDEEEVAELYAYQRASEHSAALAATGRPRRVVLAAELGTVGAPLGEDPACYLPDGPISWAAVDSIHVDDIDRDLAGALASEDAMTELTSEPLAWYDVVERQALVRE
ncbi:hypothetical protein SAMN06298212_11345 [Ruaniaceae bacterium KH17]|nr:hypothetical protein SAMN06298212_11345 [Ruaniaceae bacterium KH17]